MFSYLISVSNESQLFSFLGFVNMLKFGLHDFVKASLNLRQGTDEIHKERIPCD